MGLSAQSIGQLTLRMLKRHFNHQGQPVCPLRKLPGILYTKRTYVFGSSSKHSDWINARNRDTTASSVTAQLKE